MLVGTPTFDFHSYCLDDYERVLKSLSYPNYDVLLVDNSEEEGYCKELVRRGLPAVRMPYYDKSRMRLAEGHNILRQKVLDGGYDYLFLLDSDIIPPKDVIERLLYHGKKVVSGLYYQPMTIDKKKMYVPVIRVEIKGTKEQWALPSKDLLEPGKLVRIVASGTGCLLVHRDVLEKFKFWYDPKGKGTDDIFFFKSLFDADVECFCDTSIVCRHLLLGKPYDWESRDFKAGNY